MARAQALGTNEVTKKRIEASLRVLIARAQIDGTLLTRDWAKEPLPEYRHL